MQTLTLNILQERALEVIRYLEEVKDIQVVREEEPKAPLDNTRKSWAGAIKNPSQELLNYADEVRKEWDDRI